MNIKDIYTFRQWLTDHKEREDGVGELARWVLKQKKNPGNSEYKSWLLWYYDDRASKSKSSEKQRLGDFDQAWFEYMYDVKMKIWDYDVKKTTEE